MRGICQDKWLVNQQIGRADRIADRSVYHIVKRELEEQKHRRSGQELRNQSPAKLIAFLPEAIDESDDGDCQNQKIQAQAENPVHEF